MLERVKERLESLGYVLKDGDEVILTFSIQKVENTIKMIATYLPYLTG